MHYKTNRVNHDFQIAYFLAGSCHTADAAYSLLCDLKEDRSNALKSFEAYRLRDQAKILRAERKLATSEDEVERMEAEADLVEIAALSETTANNYKAACAELAFIEKAMEALSPHRKYKHLPEAEAHEAAQREEWKLQLVHTAENHLMSCGAIPADHWGVMRIHPDFETFILPAVGKMNFLRLNAGSKEGDENLTKHLSRPASFDMPLLIAPSEDTKALEGEQDPD